ncbi:MAG: hypothetical protein ACPLRX_04415 [Candidatus Saccharicenans sp.]
MKPGPEVIFSRGLKKEFLTGQKPAQEQIKLRIVFLIFALSLQLAAILYVNQFSGL